ncbi:MAG: hypothetical protein BRD23_03490 [Halobacteriales archaeon SW_9_67_25]|jgi:Na+/H+ antiporter NhaD/arsenite permease-like protein|nr:MAG: hypothetical protein BRD23_03490 [Halobacteriales archaeon SW_9_67_25]
MARGLPALWSAVLGAPFALGGGYVYVADPNSLVPNQVGLPVLAFGAFVIVRVASGTGGTLEIVIRNIYSPTEFADEVRTLL